MRYCAQQDRETKADRLRRQKAQEHDRKEQLKAVAPDLLDAIKQIQRLNAGKDCDIAWLCNKAIELAESNPPEHP